MAKIIETGEISVGTSGAIASLTALKKELKSVQQELAGVEEGSDAFVNLSKKAGELKDRLKDVSEATSAQAGPAFERLGNQVSLLKGDVANLDFAGAAGKIRGLAGTVKDVKFSDFTGGIKSAGQALVGLGKAIFATPLGIIVAGIAAVAGALAIWKAAALDVNDALEDQAELNKKVVEQELSDVEAVEGKTEQLKLQGKTQKEILEIKKKETAEAITALEAQLVTQEEIKRQQVESAQRNKDILSGIIQFVTAPLQLLLGTIDKVGEALGQDFGLRDGLNNFTAELLFDPEEVAKENDGAINETKKTLEKLKEQRAGYENQVNDINKAAAEKRRALAEKAAAEELSILTKAKKEVDDLYVNSISDAEDREKAKLKLTLDRTLAEIDLEIAKVKKGSDAEALLLDEKKLLNAQFERDITKIVVDEAAKRKAEEDKLTGSDIDSLEKQFTAEAALVQRHVEELKQSAEASENAIGGPGSIIEQTKIALQALSSSTAASVQAAKEAFDKANAINLEKLELDPTKIEEFEQRKAEIQASYDQAKLTAEEAQAAKEIEIVKKAEEEKQKKRAETFNKVKNGLSALSDVSSAIEATQLARAGTDEKKRAEIQKKAFNRNKALNIATTLLTTYQSATSAYASAFVPPTPASPVLGAISAGIALASGLANVAKIRATQFDGGGGASAGGGGGGASAGAPASSGTPTPQGVAFKPETIGQVEGGTPKTTAPVPAQDPIRVVVLETEISNTQRRVDRLTTRATVG